MHGYMLDTNIFNHVLRDGVELGVLTKHGALFATYVQHQELQATRDEKKRSQLTEIFNVIRPSRVSTASSLFEETPWDEGDWPSGDGLFEAMLAELNRLNGSKGNNDRDILIAETAIRNAWTLVTNDAHLGQVVRAFKGESLTLAQFLAQ